MELMQNLIENSLQLKNLYKIAKLPQQTTIRVNVKIESFSVNTFTNSKQFLQPSTLYQNLRLIKTPQNNQHCNPQQQTTAIGK